MSQDGTSFISSCFSVCQSCGPQSLGVVFYKSSGLSRIPKALENISSETLTVLRYHLGSTGFGGLAVHVCEARLHSATIDIINQVSVDLVMDLIKRFRRNNITSTTLREAI